MREERGKQKTDKRKEPRKQRRAKKTSAPHEAGAPNAPRASKTVSPPPTPKTKKLGLRLGPKPKHSPASQSARKRKQTDGYHTNILGDHFRRATHLTKLIHPAAKTRRRSAPSLPNLGNATRQKRKENRRKTKGPAPLSAPTPKRSEGLGRAQIFQIVFKNKQKGV